MSTDEIIDSLTLLQRKELEQKLHAASEDAARDFYKDPKKFGIMTSVIHLQDNITLEVKASLHQGDKDKVHPVIEEITKR